MTTWSKHPVLASPANTWHTAAGYIVEIAREHASPTESASDAQHCPWSRALARPPGRTSSIEPHLTRLADPHARAEVAVAALRHGWTHQQLIDAVDAVRGGGALDDEAIASIEAGGAVGDGDAEAGPVAKGSRQPGRLVSEAERWSQVVASWQQRWASVDAGKLRPAQRRRVLEATRRLEKQIAALRARLKIKEG